MPGEIDDVEAEICRWQHVWKDAENPPKTIIETLNACKRMRTYPNLEVLLRIFATLPVTTAPSERCFSTLKYIKNNLRSTMKEIRLNGLATLFINRDISLDYDSVINEFGRKNRLLKIS